MSARPADPLSETDEVLMGRVVRGDVRAFEVLYDRHHGQAFALARRITGAPGSAEEVTQDAFMSLWRKADGFDPKRGRLAPWLFSLVRHRSIDAVRAASSRPRHQDLPDAAERLAAAERTEQLVLASDETAQARRLVAELPAEQREVIDLAYFAGYTQSEIAAKVGVPLGTVKGRTRLGLDKLRGAAQRESVLQPAA